MRKLVLSRKASTQLKTLLEYLENEWTPKVKDNFIKKT